MDICVHGHPLDETNLRILASGKRICKACRTVNFRRWYDAHARRPRKLRQEADAATKFARSRKKRLKRFGLTPERYDQMAAEQKNLCKVCGQQETEMRDGKLLPLTVDHDHITGVVRGLLCKRCNRGLGVFCDNIALLDRAIQYLVEGKGINAKIVSG